MADETIKVMFEQISAKTEGTPSYGHFSILRARVPNGWLVIYQNSICFVPDTGHTWDGRSV